ncbi:ribosome assembly RNA-binding protein YhbY [Halarsenatibacter silvermanii]|uniref:RNA-binding protein n=1 Tax=Halarsenatibacter silvermanii TaxID=321763 RepID=A0A1G9U3P4_9FIRM|nr:ribosome assembly RNA-binding protein YhbY [Halarsenatibacter silvermanii]SDM54599.1 RNA-binding protein [Halarsenatibacter silvermanii]
MLLITDLNSKQRSFLTGESHDLNPLVHVGKEGISEGVVDQTSETLKDHELIKVRINDNAPVNAEESAEIISRRTSSEVVQIIGSVIILYKENPDDPQYNLPN